MRLPSLLSRQLHHHTPFATTLRAAWCLLCIGVGCICAWPAAAQSTCVNCGVIVSIETVAQQEEWMPLGAVSYGPNMAGGGMNEASSSFVMGQGNRGLVMIGANGGAQYAARPKSYQRQRWQVTLKMDDGSTRIVQQRYEPFVREGERVRVVGTQLELVE